jgi:hypothetical protein
VSDMALHKDIMTALTGCGGCYGLWHTDVSAREEQSSCGSLPT